MLFSQVVEQTQKKITRQQVPPSFKVGSIHHNEDESTSPREVYNVAHTCEQSCRRGEKRRGFWRRSMFRY